MRHEVEAEAIGESLHFGHGNHFASRAAQHHHMRVVDHHALGSAADVAQCVGEEHLAIEPLKRRIDLEEQHVRVAQDRRSGLRFVLPAAHLDCVWRRVVLQLNARLEVILARGHNRCFSDALPAAEGRQRRIR